MYYIVFGFLYIFSILPMRVLYLLSDVIAFLLYSVFGYRKEVVMANLLQAFPDKTEQERKKIAKKFYRNFVDHWAETLKILSAGKRTLNKMATANF